MLPETPPSRFRVLLLGNYLNDRQESMQKFCRLLKRELTRPGMAVEVLRPEPFAGRLISSGSGLGKWLGYIDKLIIFPFILRRRLAQLRRHSTLNCPHGTTDFSQSLESQLSPLHRGLLAEPRISTTLIAHICDHSNAHYTRYLQSVPHLVTCHDLLAVRTALGEIPNQWTRWTGKFLQRMILNGLRRADRLTCVSEATRQDAARLTGREIHEITVTPNGQNFAYSPMPPEQALERLARLVPSLGQGVGAQRPYLLHVGGNAWYKNRLGVVGIYAELVESGEGSGESGMANVESGKGGEESRKSNVENGKGSGESGTTNVESGKANAPVHSVHPVDPNASGGAKIPALIMVGDAFSDELENFLSRHPELRPHIIPLHDVSDDDLHALYSAAELLLFPSLAEGFGWPIIEAQACGCRVVTTGKPPMSEVGGSAAVCIAPEMLEDAGIPAAAKIVSAVLRESAEERRARVQDGFANAARFTPDGMVTKYLEIYRQMASGERPVESLALPAYRDPTQAFFESTADAYRSLFEERKSGATYAFRRRVAEVASLSAKYCGKLLDCAVGSGEVAASVIGAGKFQSAALVDFSPAMLVKAKALFQSLAGVTLEWCESDCFDFMEKAKPGSYDVLLALGLLAHTGRLELLMRLLRRVVSPGGGVLFQCTVADHAGVALHRWLSSERYFRKHGYRITYSTFDEVAAAARNAGFSIKEVRRYCIFIPFLDRIWPWANYWIERALDPVARQIGSEVIFLLEPA